MNQHDQYFSYLMGRSRVGGIYRRHVLYPQLVKRLHGRLLDVGCGIGDMLAFRASSIGVDINEHSVLYCRQRGLEAHAMAPDQLPFATASFDSALLDNVLEHIAQPAPLLAELRRVLPVGGRLLVGVPGRRGWDSDSDHKVFYDEASLVERVAYFDFSLIELFHMPLFRSTCLSRYVRQYCIYGAFDRV